MTRASTAFALMLAAIALGIVNIALLEARPPNAGLPLVSAAPVGVDGPRHQKADFPLCVNVKPAPLLRTPRGRVDFRLGKPSNDRGET